MAQSHSRRLHSPRHLRPRASLSFLVKQPGGLGYKLHSKCSKSMMQGLGSENEKKLAWKLDFLYLQQTQGLETVHWFGSQ